MTAGRDLIWADEMAKQRPYCPCEVMDSEDTLFLLYTSGTVFHFHQIVDFTHSNIEEACQFSKIHAFGDIPKNYFVTNLTSVIFTFISYG